MTSPDLLVPAFFTAFFVVLWAAAFLSIPWLYGRVRGAAGRLAGWLREHARLAPAFGRIEAHRSYLPLVLTLAIGTVLTVVTADAFVDVASALAGQDPGIQRLDTAVYEWCRLNRTPFLNALFIGITTAGGALGMGALVLASVSILSMRKRYRWAAYLLITAAGGVLLNQLLKAHYTRPRPDPTTAILGADGYSFPSGHTMGATYVLCAVGYLVARAMPTWKTKSAAFAALGTLVLAIAFSRPYLGAHWASDIAAGFAAGLLWVTATTCGYELVRQYRLKEARAARVLARASRAPGRT